LKISGVPIRHLNAWSTGPFGWITNGLLDIDLHVHIPKLHEETILEKVQDEVQDFRDTVVERIEEALPESFPVNNTQEEITDIPDPVSSDDLVMHWKVNLRDLKASVPLITSDVSMLGQAVIRPIVGYMNANKTCIPVSFEAKMNKVNNSSR
jgi:distribution and morphology protein 31